MGTDRAAGKAQRDRAARWRSRPRQPGLGGSWDRLGGSSRRAEGHPAGEDTELQQRSEGRSLLCCRELAGGEESARLLLGLLKTKL